MLNMSDTNDNRNNMALDFIHNALIGGNFLSVDDAFNMADQFIKRSKIPVDESQKIAGVSTATEIQITNLIDAGRWIDAIKVYRNATGADLKTAKDVIDSMRTF